MRRSFRVGTKMEFMFVDQKKIYDLYIYIFMLYGKIQIPSEHYDSMSLMKATKDYRKAEYQNGFK